jgi:hypothetical protein
MFDLHNNIKVVGAYAPIIITADADGGTVDRQGFESVEHVVFLGATGDTLSGSVYAELVLQHSDNGSTWVDVTSADDVLVGNDGVSAAPDANGVFATIDANAEDERHFRIGYRGGKRYSRVQCDLTGSHSNGIEFCAIGILGHPHQAPTSD